MEFAVHQRHQFVERSPVAAAPAVQDARDVRQSFGRAVFRYEL
jgi:hypothetical protein